MTKRTRKLRETEDLSNLTTPLKMVDASRHSTLKTAQSQQISSLISLNVVEDYVHSPLKYVTHNENVIYPA